MQTIVIVNNMTKKIQIRKKKNESKSNKEMIKIIIKEINIVKKVKIIMTFLEFLEMQTNNN